MPTTGVKIDDRRIKNLVKKIQAKGENFTVPLNEFRQYMAVQVDGMWSVLSSGGGTHRGEKWKPFSAQYARKDGTRVPHYGGIQKVRGQGKVKGKKRPSGRRMTSTSQLMQDTGTLRSRATSVLFRRTKTSISFGTSPTLKYASSQAAMRPYLFFYMKKDVGKLRQILDRFLKVTGGK